MANPSLYRLEQIPPDTSFEENVGHHQEHRHRQQHKALRRGMQCGRHHERRETAGQKQDDAETTERKGDGDTQHQKAKKGTKNSNRQHCGLSAPNQR